MNFHASKNPWLFRLEISDIQGYRTRGFWIHYVEILKIDCSWNLYLLWATYRLKLFCRLCRYQYLNVSFCSIFSKRVFTHAFLPITQKSYSAFLHVHQNCPKRHHKFFSNSLQGATLWFPCSELEKNLRYTSTYLIFNKC